MIYFIMKCYLSIFIAVGLSSILLFAVGCRLLFGKNRVKELTQAVPRAALGESGHQEIDAGLEEEEINNFAYEIQADYSTIAGEDIFTTQLDLARAYIELGKLDDAKDILHSVATQGSNAQQDEARMLLMMV